MNKNIVNDEIQMAYEALNETGIVKDNKIIKTFRGYISTFGAAIVMGSLLSAIAFYMEDSKETTERNKLMETILEVLKKNKLAEQNEKDLFEYSRKRCGNKEEAACREDIINAAIAIKLAMNLYELV